MAIREFTASDGERWRAWDVLPESIEPLTKAEDFLAECYRDGWVVFETLDGSEKRRLCPPPYEWSHRSDANLEDLLVRAEILRPGGQRRMRGDSTLPADLPPTVPLEVASEIPRDVEGDIDMRYLRIVRSFRYSGREVWKVSVLDEGAHAPLKLRFSSETQTIDVADWPADWADLSDDELAALMKRGRPSTDRPYAGPSRLDAGDTGPGAPG